MTGLRKINNEALEALTFIIWFWSSKLKFSDGASVLVKVNQKISFSNCFGLYYLGVVLIQYPFLRVQLAPRVALTIYLKWGIWVKKVDQHLVRIPA